MTDEKAAFIEKYKNGLEEATGKKLETTMILRKTIFYIQADLSHSYN